MKDFNFYAGFQNNKNSFHFIPCLMLWTTKFEMVNIRAVKFSFFLFNFYFGIDIDWKYNNEKT